MSKLTEQQKVNKLEYKKVNPIIFGALYFFVIRLVFKRKYNVHILNNAKEAGFKKGPAIVFYNHQSRIDYAYIMLAFFPRRLNFVVGYNEFFRKHLAFIMRHSGNIPKRNFNTDPAGLKAMLSILKQNGILCMAPEGMSSISGHNQPVGLGTGSFLKHCKLPVYQVKLSGAYLTNTKVCLDERKGRVDVEVEKLYDPEDLVNKTNEEIEEELNKVLWHDDYEWNRKEKISFNGHGRMAEHLHDICYICPKCGKEFTMIGKGDILKCTSCGNGAKINSYYEFEPLDNSCVLPVSPSKWMDEERQIVAKQVREKDFKLQEHVKLGALPTDHFVENKGTSEIVGEGIITLDQTGFTFEGTRDNKPFSFHLIPEEFPTTGVVTDCTFFSLYYKGEYFDIFLEKPSFAKWLLSIEEMHRYHNGRWKQFPWIDTYKYIDEEDMYFKK